jgi:transglutaminase-like putative cysteine protease
VSVAATGVRFRVVHRTHYRYALPVELCHNEAHLQPRDTPAQRSIASRIAIDPPPLSLHARKDYFGNPTTYFTARLPHRELAVTATSEVEVHGGAPADAPVPDSPPWEEARSVLHSGTTAVDLEARELTLASPMVEPSAALREFAAPSFPPGRPLFAAVAALSRRIHREFTYDKEFSTIATPLAAVLERQRGVCQDFAHLAIGCLRSLSLPARYVSGYIETAPEPGERALAGADASHAWFASYAPGAGWLELDPTNDQVPPRQHIATAWGRDYSDVTPLKGVLFGGGEHTLSVAVEVIRVGHPGPPAGRVAPALPQEPT